jgi:restriction system protein
MLTWLSIALAALIGYSLGRHRAHRLQNSSEARVCRSIQQTCTSPDWHLLNNVTLPTADGTTQIDHVLVSRYGIFVIETKNYSGWIFGDARSEHWTQVIYKKKSRFQNPLRQNYKHIKTVQALLDFLPPEQVRGMVVFTGDAEFKTKRPEDVFTLSELLSTLGKLDTEVMSLNRLQFCVGRLECHRFALTRQTDIDHQAHLKRRFADFS